MDPQLANLARRLQKLERGQLLRKQPQLAFSSIEDGALKATDVDGNVTMLVGKQYDSTSTSSVIKGPTPPTPTPALVTPTAGGLKLYWDGTFVDDLVAPMDFRRVTAHIVESMDGFDPTNPATIVAEFGSATGFEVSIALEEGDYLVVLIAWSQAGKFSAFSDPQIAAPGPVEGVVTGPPTTSPTLTASGTVDSIIATAGPIERGARLQYHISEDPDFDPKVTGAATMYGIETTSRVTVIGSAADGAALDPEKSYTVRVLAVNALGSAPAASAPVSVQLDPSILADIIAATLAVGFLLSGRIMVGDIELTPDGGIVIPHGTTGRATVLKSTGSTFVGEATFDALTTLGNLTINGTTNFVNGLLTLRSGVGDPLQRPTVTSDYSKVAAQGLYNPRGLTKGADNTWVHIEYIQDNGSVLFKSATTGANVVGWQTVAGWLPVGGAVAIGDLLYVLCGQSVNNGWDYSRTAWRVYIYTAATGALVGYQTPTGVDCTGSNSRPMIGHVAGDTNYIIGYVKGSALYTREYTAAHGTLQAIRTLSTSWGAADVCGVARQPVPSPTGLYDATPRTVVASPSGVFVWDPTTGATATRIPAEDWLPASPGLRGIYREPGTEGRWYSATDAAVARHTNNSGPHDFAYTWADTDPGGDPANGGLAQTKRSPVLTTVPRRMARWVVTLPDAPPDDGTVDGANAAYVYATPSGGGLVRQGAALEPPVLSRELDLVETSGSTPPATSGFASRTSTAVGRMTIQRTDTQGALIDFQGNGAGRAGPTRWGVDGKSLDQIYESAAAGGTYSPTAPVTGVEPVGIADLTFVAPTSGRVQVIMSIFQRNLGTNGSVLYWPRVRQGETLRQGAIVRDSQNGDAVANYGASFVRAPAIAVVSGLVPGATYNVVPVMTCTATSGASWTLGWTKVIPLV